MSVTVAAPRGRVALRRPRRVPWNSLATAAILLVLALTDILLQPALLSFFQMGLLMQTALPLVLVGAAQTLVVLVRGIDLSVGGMLVVANAVTVTWVGAGSGAHQLLLIAVIAIALAMGALNGLLVAVLRYEPFVATLGTWTIFNGIALLILPTDGGTPPPQVLSLTLGSVAGVPNSIIALLVLFVAWRLLKGSRLGTRIYAVGADEQRARLGGTSVVSVKLAAYMLAGLCAGLAGIALAGATSSGTPTVGDAYILNSVAAVVIGGTSLKGGSGGIGLTMMAALALTFMWDIISAVNLSSWVSVAASAGLLLVVVVVRSFVTRVLEGRKR